MWVTTSRSCGVHEQARAWAPASLSEGLSRPHLRSLNQTAASLVHRLPPATPPTPTVTRQQPLQGLRPQAGRGVRDSYPPPAPGCGADRRRRPLRTVPLCVCLCSWLTKALAAEQPVGVACSPRASQTPGTPPTCLCLIVTPDLRSGHLGEPRVSCTLSWSRGWKRRPWPSGLAVVHVRPRACVRTVPSARAPGRAPGRRASRLCRAGSPLLPAHSPSSSLHTGFDLMDLFRVKEILGRRENGAQSSYVRMGSFPVVQRTE